MAKPGGRSAGAARPATSNTDTVSVDAESRAKRFMKSALAILGETGRTDFTVLEVVERSKTSLRSFYQHFSTKDELLLALIDKIMSESTKKWREDTTGLESTAALRVLIDRICTPAESSTQDRVNRGLTDYNDHLAETLPREYARVLSAAARVDQGHHQPRHRRGHVPPGARRRRHRRADHAVGARRHAAASPGRRTERRADRCRPHLRLLRQRPRRPRPPRLTCAIPAVQNSA